MPTFTLCYYVECWSFGYLSLFYLFTSEKSYTILFFSTVADHFLKYIYKYFY